MWDFEYDFGGDDSSNYDFGYGDISYDTSVPDSGGDWWDGFDFSGGGSVPEVDYFTDMPADTSDFFTDMPQTFTGGPDTDGDFFGPSAGNPNFEQGFDLNAARQAEMDRYNEFMAGDQQLPTNDFYGNQFFGNNAITDRNLAGMDAGYGRAVQNGGFTSGYQTTPSGERVMIQDDGSAIAIDPRSGSSRGILAEDVMKMVKGGELNTNRSGYNAATGGDMFGPGGSSSILRDLLGGAKNLLGGGGGGGQQRPSSGAGGSGSGAGGEQSQPQQMSGTTAPRYNFEQSVFQGLPIQTIASLLGPRK